MDLVSKCEQECHNHTLQINPWHREEEPKNNNSNINSVTFRLPPFCPQNHNLNKLDRVPLGDANIKSLGILLCDKNILMFALYNLHVYVKHVTPWAALFWHQGHNFNKFSRRLLGYAIYQILDLDRVVLDNNILCVPYRKPM